MGSAIDLNTSGNIVDRSDNTTRYYKDIRGYNYPEKEEEESLFDLYKNGTPEERVYARDKIILGHQRLIISCAKKYATTENLMDYVNEANIALLHAVDKYDPSVGVKFISFAIWYIKRALNTYSAVMVPIVRKSNVTKTCCVIKRITSDFCQKNERLPTEDELLDEMNEKYGKHGNISDKNDLLDVRTCSIMSEDDIDSDPTAFRQVMEYNRVTQTENGSVSISETSYVKVLAETMLSALSPRDQLIMRLSFGISDDNGMHREHTASEIAGIVGCSTERVRQIIKMITRKLRKKYDEGFFSVI